MPNAHQVGGINLPAAIGLAVMILVFAASLVVGEHRPPPDADPPEDDGRGGGGERPPSPGPQGSPGGIPLADADPASIRLRGQRPPIQRSPGRRPRDPDRQRRPAPRR